MPECDLNSQHCCHRRHIDVFETRVAHRWVSVRSKSRRYWRTSRLELSAQDTVVDSLSRPWDSRRVWRVVWARWDLNSCPRGTLKWAEKRQLGFSDTDDSSACRSGRKSSSSQLVSYSSEMFRPMSSNRRLTFVRWFFRCSLVGNDWWGVWRILRKPHSLYSRPSRWEIR